MRPITLLALVATATSSVASPLPPTVERVVQKLTAGHRRSDSLALELGVEGLKKHHELVDLEAQMDHHGKHHRSVSISEAAEVIAQIKPSSRSRIHNQRHVIDILPSQAPAPKAGLVDVHAGVGDAHLVQTPGKDKTIVDVNPGPADVKVNLPTEGPVKDEVHDTQKDADDAFHGAGKNLAGKKGGPLDGVVNDGHGGPQGLEIAIGSDDQEHQSSSTSQSSSMSKSASQSSARPTSSAAPRSPAAPRSSASRSASGSASAPSNSAQPTSSARPPARSSASSSASRTSAPSSSSARPSQSSSSAQPTQSEDGSGFQILPGAFAAARQSGKASLDSIIVPVDPHDTQPGQSHGGITVDPGHKAVGSTLGQNPDGPKDKTTPARIEFGHLPKNAVPCDGVNVRDKGEVVDVCIEVALVDQRPKGYDACPGYETHEVALHADSKDLTNKVSTDVAKVVKLCVGAGVL